MKKINKILLSVSCVVISTTLFFVGQQKLKSTILISENVEAVTNAEGDTQVSIETAVVYKIETNPERDGFYAPMLPYPIQGTPFSDQDHSIFDWIIHTLFGGFPSGDYWCNITLGQVQTPYTCFDIIVSTN